MGKEYFELIRVALEQKGLTLVGSLARVIILLPERGRTNVLVRRADGEEDTATIFLSQDGNLTVVLSGELDDVPRLPVKTVNATIFDRFSPFLMSAIHQPG